MTELLGSDNSPLLQQTDTQTRRHGNSKGQFSLLGNVNVRYSGAERPLLLTSFSS